MTQLTKEEAILSLKNLVYEDICCHLDNEDEFIKELQDIVTYGYGAMDERERDFVWSYAGCAIEEWLQIVHNKEGHAFFDEDVNQENYTTFDILTSDILMNEVITMYCEKVVEWWAYDYLTLINKLPE